MGLLTTLHTGCLGSLEPAPGPAVDCSGSFGVHAHLSGLRCSRLCHVFRTRASLGSLGGRNPDLRSAVATSGQHRVHLCAGGLGPGAPQRPTVPLSTCRLWIAVETEDPQPQAWKHSGFIGSQRGAGPALRLQQGGGRAVRLPEAVRRVASRPSQFLEAAHSLAGGPASRADDDVPEPLCHPLTLWFTYQGPVGAAGPQAARADLHLKVLHSSRP